MRQRFCQIRSRRIHILTISERGFARVFSSLSIEYKKKDRKGFLVRAMRVSLSFSMRTSSSSSSSSVRERVYSVRARFLLLKKWINFFLVLGVQNRRKK